MRSPILLFVLLATTTAFAQDREPKTADRIDASADILRAMLNPGSPGNNIPNDLIEKARCVVVIPGMKKAGFIVAARYGKGFAVCRRSNSNRWSAPAAMIIEGGSVGFQIGATDEDVVLLIMNQRGIHDLISDKFTIGGAASAAAGPVGREVAAQTSGWADAEILSYGRTRGVFAGISLNGASLRPDHDDNRALYGRNISTREILLGRIAAPRDARRLDMVLNHETGNQTRDYGPRHAADSHAGNQ